ncbi:MAG: CPBP family glutamic-type intramembrane protease [Planctomycetota bacterium]|jgi:membrane protease YdiL (CAAX protease family)
MGWLLVAVGFFTAGLLRQHHGSTPKSPFVPTIVGSLLFGFILVLLLVSELERRRGASPGRGVRLGSLMPILLMLMIEKWASLSLYRPLFHAVAPSDETPVVLDAQFRTFAGVGMILVCLLLARLSIPSGRKTWRRAGPARWPAAALATVLVVGATYLLLGAAAAGLGAGLQLRWPEWGSVLLWILVGQAVLAFGEELYYRGLLLSEMERLAPRLGARSAALRRWIALGSTSALFGLEHLALTAQSTQTTRQLIFTVSLGLLLGLLIMVSANLHFAAGIHAWINWLLLGAAPHFVDAQGEPALPAGTYIGLTMILAFVWSYVYRRLRHRPA